MEDLCSKLRSLKDPLLETGFVKKILLLPYWQLHLPEGPLSLFHSSFMLGDVSSMLQNSQTSYDGKKVHWH
jgi:hypothetical protein